MFCFNCLETVCLVVIVFAAVAFVWLVVYLVCVCVWVLLIVACVGFG